MHILFLGDGGSRNTVNWVRYYTQVLNHRVTLLSFDPALEPIPGVECLDLSGETKLKFLYQIPRVRRLIRELQPDLVLAYRITSYGLTAACSGFHPFVVAAMGRDVNLLHTSMTRRLAVMFTVRQADLIHSWGPNMTKRLIKLGADPGRILTLPRGVNTDLFYPKGERLSIQTRILSTRALDPYYRIDVIIRAIADLFTAIPQVECRLAGDGPERMKLEQLTEALGIQGYVRFLGKVNYAGVAEELRAADIYVSAVPTDGTSSSLLEAMACGIFPIVVDNSSNRVWVSHGKNGFLYPAGDVSMLARLLAMAIADPKLRAEAAAFNVEQVRVRADSKTNMKIMEEWHLDLCKRFGFGIRESSV